ncbi:ester cyclase [Nocardia sp. NPDC050175]|uniref:ester cyclase n=1 Tax=Nocardia sp. NPDC050175 TaxID=3364317 RepID=UPI0037AF7961
MKTDVCSAISIATTHYALYDTGDVTGVDKVFAPDLIDHNPVPGAPTGIEGMRMLIGEVRIGFTDTHHEIVFQRELPNGWVVSHWRMTATHAEDAFGAPASGRPVSFNGTDIVRVADGRIIEIYHVAERLQMQVQLTA